MSGYIVKILKFTDLKKTRKRGATCEQGGKFTDFGPKIRYQHNDLVFHSAT